MQGSNEEADTENRLVDTVEEGEDGMTKKSTMEIYTLPYVKWIASRNLLCDNLGDRMGWEGFQEGGDTGTAACG